MRAAGVLAKGRMFDMPALDCREGNSALRLLIFVCVCGDCRRNKDKDCLRYCYDRIYPVFPQVSEVNVDANGCSRSRRRRRRHHHHHHHHRASGPAN